MQYVKIVKKAHYEVNVRGFSLGDVSIPGFKNLNTPRSIVDTGTTQFWINGIDNYNILINALMHSNLVTGFPNQAVRETFWKKGQCTYVTLNRNLTLTVDMEGPDGKTVKVPYFLDNLFVKCNNYEIRYDLSALLLFF